MDKCRTWAMANAHPRRVFSDIENQFYLSQEHLTELARAFVEEMRMGLREYHHPMAMIPTFVTRVPNGTETGTFLSLDLGGTNLRVCAVKLHGDRTFSLAQQKYKVSDSLKTGEATALFDYLADSVDKFLTSPVFTERFGSESSATPTTVHLGLTFSFPVEQTALDSGVLLTWTKGFSAKNAVGKDVVKLLQDAFDRKHMHVKCIALINDTVGTLLCHAYRAGKCTLGAILGTGTNGAYVERTSNITKLSASKEGLDSEMVINCEWGAFNNTRTHLPTTPYDKALDRVSINPTFQTFEKFISGMYLGEITRLVLLSLVDATPVHHPAGPPPSLLLKGRGSPVMNNAWAVDSSVMSELEEAWEAGRHDGEVIPEGPPYEESQLSETSRKRLERVSGVVVKRFGYKDSDVELCDAAVIRWVSAVVARRAAMLSGVAVAAVLIQTGRAVLGGKSEPKVKEDTIMVGMDGSLIEHYPNFERMLRESLRMVIGEEVERRVDIGMAKDGSGVGAALGALQALKH